MTTTKPKKVTARKRHLCNWCSEAIQPNERYQGWTQFDNDGIQNIRLHTECSDAFEELMLLKNMVEGDSFNNDNPRGCNCDWDEDCERCKLNMQAHRGMTGSLPSDHGPGSTPGACSFSSSSYGEN